MLIDACHSGSIAPGSVGSGEIFAGTDDEGLPIDPSFDAGKAISDAFHSSFSVSRTYSDVYALTACIPEQVSYDGGIPSATASSLPQCWIRWDMMPIRICPGFPEGTRSHSPGFISGYGMSLAAYRSVMVLPWITRHRSHRDSLRISYSSDSPDCGDHQSGASDAMLP